MARRIPKNCGRALVHITPARLVWSELPPSGKIENVRWMDDEPDHRILPAGHGVLSLLFVVALLIYIVFTCVDYAMAPTPSTMAMIPSQQLGTPMKLQISVTCVTPPCGTAYVVENYTAYPATMCAQINGGFRSQPISATPIVVNLCYTNEEPFVFTNPTKPLPVSQLQVYFTGITGFANVSVTSVGDGGAAISRSFGMDANMIKAFTLSGTLTTMDDVFQSLDPYGLTYETEVDSLTTNFAAIWFRMNPVIGWRKKTSGQSVIDLLASIGNGYETIDTAFLVLVPLAVLLFAAKPEEPSADVPKPPAHGPPATTSVDVSSAA